MIQIPLEIGDTILAGRFKNKKITVKEISYDEYGNPTVNGRSILKIRIPKLYQKQENNMKLNEENTKFYGAIYDPKYGTDIHNLRSVQASNPIDAFWKYSKVHIDDENKTKMIQLNKSTWVYKENKKVVIITNDENITAKKLIPLIKNKIQIEAKLREVTEPFSKQTNVKIKQENKRWHIYLETVDGDECLTPIGYETKEQAEHAAMMKGYNFKGNPYSEDYEGLEVEKPTKREVTKGTDKPEEMKLGKEKEIKLESIIRRAIREVKKKVKLKENASKYFDYIKNADLYGWDNVFDVLSKDGYNIMSYRVGSVPSAGSTAIDLTRKSPKMQDDVKVVSVYEDKKDGGIIVKTNKAFLKFWSSKLKETFKLKEELSESELEQKARRFAELAQKMKVMESELKQMELEYENLDQELTPLVEQIGKTKDTFIRAGKILIKIEREGYKKKNKSYKTGFEYLYKKVNATMKDLAEEALKMTETVSYVKSKISVVQGESNLKEENWFQKIKNFLGSKIKKLFGLNNQANQLLTQLESKI